MSSPLTDLIVVAALLLLTGTWIYGLRKAEESACERLGEDVETVLLQNRWARILSGVFAWGAFLLPAISLWLLYEHRIDSSEILPDIARSAWLGSVAFAVRRGVRLIIGTNGFSLARTITPWKEVEDVKWDRDIGQRQWGATIMTKKKFAKKPVKQRIYVRRDLKEHVEALFDRFRGIGQSAIAHDQSHAEAVAA